MRESCREIAYFDERSSCIEEAEAAENSERNYIFNQFGAVSGDLLKILYLLRVWADIAISLPRVFGDIHSFFHGSLVVIELKVSLR